MKGHKCRANREVIKPCSRHKGLLALYKPTSIPKERIVGFDKINNIYTVYFQLLKCRICGDLPVEFIQCGECSALFCKDCPFYHNNMRLAQLSEMKPSCSVCLSRVYENKMSQDLDRNIKNLLSEDLKISCIFKSEEKCTMKEASIYTMFEKHQGGCAPCQDCLYACPFSAKMPFYTKKCSCTTFYSANDLARHIEEVKSRASGIRPVFPREREMFRDDIRAEL